MGVAAQKVNQNLPNLGLSIPTIAKKSDFVLYETTRVTKNRLAAAF